MYAPTYDSKSGQSKKKVTSSSAPLNTEDRFEFTFEESETCNYFCSFHTWRVRTVAIK